MKKCAKRLVIGLIVGLEIEALTRVCDSNDERLNGPQG